jgi:polyisoprenoid-binding protein YceI
VKQRIFPKHLRAAGAALCLALASPGVLAPAQAAPQTYEIDTEHLSIGFQVSHAGYENLLGMFLEGSGTFSYDADSGAIGDLRIVIAADSVFTNHDKRDRHLRGSDFLNAGEFPEIVFTGQRAEKTGDNTGLIHGELELLGVRKPLTVDVTLNKAAKYSFGHKKFTLGLSARASFKRSDFGMTYAVDGGLVGDTVDLIFEFEALPR